MNGAVKLLWDSAMTKPPTMRARATAATGVISELNARMQDTTSNLSPDNMTQLAPRQFLTHNSSSQHTHMEPYSQAGKDEGFLSVRDSGHGVDVGRLIVIHESEVLT